MRPVAIGAAGFEHTTHGPDMRGHSRTARRAERSSNSFTSRIGGRSGVGRDSGGGAGESQHVSTKSCSKNNALNLAWRDVYDQCRQFDILKGGGLLARVPRCRKYLK